MKKVVTASALVACLAMGFLTFLVGASGAQDDWQQQVAQALGKAGTGSRVASIGSACRARISRRRWTASS